MNIVKTQLTNLLLINMVVDFSKDELIFQEFHNMDDGEDAEKKFIEFWGRSLLKLPVSGVEFLFRLNRYKIIQIIIKLKSTSGDIKIFFDWDDLFGFDESDNLFFKRDLRFYDFDTYKSLCKLYNIEIPEDIIEIEKRLRGRS